VKPKVYGIVNCALACALIACGPRSDGDFVFVSSRSGPGLGDQSVLIHSRMPVAAPQFREAAAAFAQQWNPLRNNSSSKYIAVHFFASLPAAQIGNEYEAALTYCMHRNGGPPAWMPDKGDCFAHEAVTDRAQKNR